jgi:outer membrane protein TolC
MAEQPLIRRLILAGCVWGLVMPLLALGQATAGPEEPVVVLTKEPAEPLPGFRVAKPAPLTLTDCIQLGLENQPALAAARASLAAAEAAQQAVDHLRLLGLVNHEIDVRRQQAALGVSAASAGACQAEWEAIYAITRNLFTAQYARIQEKVASTLVDQLKATGDAAQGQVDAGSKTTTQDDVDKVRAYQALAQLRVQEARSGFERAVAALREAMGVPQDYLLNLAVVPLPTVKLDLTRAQAVSLALARRAEMTQVTNVAEITSLEVDAQGTSFALTFRTFAANADVHARPVPAGERNGQYRPDALGVEMPTLLAGCRRDRMNRARELNIRANAVVDKTRNLIALEASESFLKWQQASASLANITAAAGKAKKLGQKTQEAFAGGAKVTVKDVLDTLLLSAQSQASANETVYNQILAVAGLERVTAGGINPGWGGRPAHK